MFSRLKPVDVFWSIQNWFYFVLIIYFFSQFESWQVNCESKSLHDVWRPIVWEIGSVEHDWQNLSSTDRCCQLVISLLMSAIHGVIQLKWMACYLQWCCHPVRTIVQHCLLTLVKLLSLGEEKSMCAGVPHKKMEEKGSLEKLNCMTLHSVPPTLERKHYMESVFYMENRRQTYLKASSNIIGVIIGDLNFLVCFKYAASISQYQCINTSL